MDFSRERKTEFEEADRRYAELRRGYEAGDVSLEEFDAQLKKLMLQDSEGHWWAKSRQTGDWYYHDGATWIQGMPPSYRPAPAVAPDDDRNPPPQTVERPRPSRRQAMIAVVVVVVSIVLISLGEVGGHILVRLLFLLLSVWIGLRIARAMFRQARDQWWVTLIGWGIGLFLWLFLLVVAAIGAST